ncbi:MAG: glutaredoxin family protein [Syntrophobacteraceae bacterium]|jgi:glutaredoxin|nr:glutaredoxin family protein [Syntrophobacteraceae bacterium]
MSTPIVLYGLMSCAHCKEVRELLMDRQIPFESIYLDLLLGEERSETMRELRRINPEVTFPTVVIGEKVIVGFKKDQIEEAIGGLAGPKGT